MKFAYTTFYKRKMLFIYKIFTPIYIYKATPIHFLIYMTKKNEENLFISTLQCGAFLHAKISIK